MPIHSPFNFPYLYNNYNTRNSYYQNTHNQGTRNIKQVSEEKPKVETNTKKIPENSRNVNTISESSEYFFEIFGLKLHFDDVLIMCILFCLYKEDVHDEELFLCLILLLLS